MLFGFGEFFWAGVVLIVANLFDMLDGNVARQTGNVTKFGGFLDSSLDRLSDMVVFLGIMIFYAGKLAQHSIVNVAAGRHRNDRSVMVSYTTARSEGLGVKANVGVSAAAGACRPADNRRALDVELEFGISFRQPNAAGAVGAGGRFDLDADPANVLYLEGVSPDGRREPVTDDGCLFGFWGR